MFRQRTIVKSCMGYKVANPRGRSASVDASHGRAEMSMREQSGKRQRNRDVTVKWLVLAARNLYGSLYIGVLNIARYTKYTEADCVLTYFKLTGQQVWERLRIYFELPAGADCNMNTVTLAIFWNTCESLGHIISCHVYYHYCLHLYYKVGQSTSHLIRFLSCPSSFILLW